jgi:uncharacterized phage protein (TIGR01671 family)
MREFKFRFWDIVNSKYVMLEDDGLQYMAITDNGVLLQIFGHTYLPFYSDKVFVPQQYIGWKDKERKEIYEGDIVSVVRNDSFPSYNRGVIQYINQLGAFVVVTNKKSKIIGKRLSDDKVFFHLNDWPNLCIIGNIYENGDLLQWE